MPDNTIVTATTSAATGYIEVEKGQAVTIAAYNLAGAETVNIELKVGDNYTQVYDTSGAALKLTATQNPLMLVAPGTYQLSKSSTASAASVHSNKG